MIIMNKILVAYDCSAEAKKALEHALSIAQPAQEIIILTVIPEPDSIFGTDEPVNITTDDLEADLKEFEDKIKSNNLKLTTKIVQGNIIKEIVIASSNPTVGLVVLGYKGVSKIGKFKLGSVSGEVAKQVKKPVLIIK
jgi:nucleotide-binding universal stress UspA family protein